MTRPVGARRGLVHRVGELVASEPERPLFVTATLDDEGEVLDEVSLAAGTMYRRASALAAGLTAMRLAERRVALAVHLGEEAVVLYLACQLAGLAPAMLPVPARAVEVAAFAATVAPLAAAFSPDVVIFDRRTLMLVTEAEQLDVWRAGAARVLTEAELVSEAAGSAVLEPEASAGARLSGDAPAHYLFTSGTTGRSKIVRLSRAAVEGNALYVAERWGFGDGDRLPATGAPYHSAGLMVGLVMPLCTGGTGVIAPPGSRPAPAWHLLSLVAGTRCTHLSCGDGMVRAALLGLFAERELRYPALRALIIGGEPLDLRTYELVDHHFASRTAAAFEIYTAYGMTEAAGLISSSTTARPTRLFLAQRELDRGRIVEVDRSSPGAVALVGCGSPSHEVKVRVVDEDGQMLPDSVLGHVEFRSGCLFDGYVSAPEEAGRPAAALAMSATSQCRDGYLATGDLGFVRGGELFVRGRHKEAIVVAGALVPADRIESVAREACLAAAGLHNLAVPAHVAGEGATLLLQEVAAAGGDPNALADAAAAIGTALLRELALPAVDVALFAPGALPRLCTSAKKVRLLAAAAMGRGDLVSLGRWRFTASSASSSSEPGTASDRGELAWSAAELAAERWLCSLPAELAAEANDAARSALHPAEFSARLRQLLARALAEVADGGGFAVLRGLPTELPPHQLEQLVLTLGRALGRLMPQNPAGQLLTHVSDRGGGAASRGYLSREALAFHSDTSDVLALYCVRGAARGGETALVSSLRVLRELAALDAADVLEGLRAGFAYGYPEDAARPVGDAPAAERTPIPVFSEVGGKVSCRYLRAFIELAERQGGPPLSPAQRRVLDRFDALTSQPALQHRLSLRPGDLLLVNNYTVLHSRTAFEDSDEESERRLLLRLWLNVPEFRPLIPALRGLSERFTNAHAGPELRDPRAPSLLLDRRAAEAGAAT